MKTILKSIALNEKSFNVNLLHKALLALGFPVAKKEITQGKAGADTLKKVRDLQAQLNVPVDESVLVDEATALAFSAALKKRGLTAANRSFTVTGRVVLLNGFVKKRQRLFAFDLDLRGVAVYREVKKLLEVRKNRGFEYLGEAESDKSGNYRITFYDWQYGQAERKKADVVVYALDGGEIVGRSRMVNSEEYSDKGLVGDLDVFIEKEDERAEYEVLMSPLNAFLKESKSSLDVVAKSQDQLIFTAGELDVEQSRINIAAAAELLAKQEEEQELSHELLYGIGRQNIRLSWPALYKKQEEMLRDAVAASIDDRIIRNFNKEEIDKFLHAIRDLAVEHKLDEKEANGGNTLNKMLKNALPEKKQRLTFLNALRKFKGRDFREFWKKHLPAQPVFKDNPELISGLLLTQQLTLLTGNHQALVNELQVNQKLSSISQLLDLEENDLAETIEKIGVPDFIVGKDDAEKISRYTELMQGLFNAAFPTRRIAKMAGRNELSIEKNRVSNSINQFLADNQHFDFAGYRIHDFKQEIKDAKAAAKADYDEVRNELMKIQRVFQVSTSPEAMRVLLESKLHSAYTIANIPRKSFINKYGSALGGEHVAFAIHQRASHISTRAEMTAMHLLEYSHGYLPKSIMDSSEYSRTMDIIRRHMPNPTPTYRELFGSPDICECRHCRSVHSPAAYFVDLLRFLEHSGANSEGHTPYDILIGKGDLRGRRPDLAHLLLTCENTNTIIPYIDLANEVMEDYTANDSLANFEGYDNGDASAEELRANPQNFIRDAYSKLKDAKYPFTLPYHQPLDVIRTYSDHLKVSRYEAMKAINPEPDAPTGRAIGAESIGLSQEEYIILTGETFEATPVATDVHEYYGYNRPDDFTDMQEKTDADGNPRGISVLLERTGLAYTDLVELVKTRFINPLRAKLDFIEKIFAYGSIDNSTIYERLARIEAGTLVPSDDAEINAALNAYNQENDPDITSGDFAEYISGFGEVITLFEPDSKCNLATTKLRTIQSIYEGSDTSEIIENSWPRMHRFIRLWRKLGWTIQETDIMLAAFGEDDITTETISKLESTFLLRNATKLPCNYLAVLWGNIDTYGVNSLYRELFLNRTVRQIDEAFKADARGNYLQDDTAILTDHQSAILLAFRMTEEDLDAILQVAEVIDGRSPRNLEMDSDILNIQNLGTIYRYVVLARGLKIRVTDLCRLISLFDASPFSTWDIDQVRFVNISPKDTYAFFELAASTRTAGFKPSELEYILQGTVAADSNVGLDRDNVLQTAKTIHDEFAAIEQDHMQTPALPLTTEIVSAKLSLTFQAEAVNRIMDIIKGTAIFEMITDVDLEISIPDDLSHKFNYNKSSGRLRCNGIMTESEKSTLRGLTNASSGFKASADALYAAPDTFIRENFEGVFGDLSAAMRILLNRPAQATAADLDRKLEFVYESFIPLLKKKLRRDTLTQHIAALIGLSEEATGLLIASSLDRLDSEFSTEGFSANYFSDATWSTSVLERSDKTINFRWGDSAPATLVPADNFSVKWIAYLAAPASGQYTLVVEVEDADEAFKLYLDETLILEKTPADADSRLEVGAELNSAQMHLLTLEYSEASDDAGVRLYWKLATAALEIIPAAVVYPAAIFDNFVKQATEFHQAAQFISGFDLSETEISHFINHKEDFDNINFEGLEARHWIRIRDYTTLRNAVPQAQALLTDVFALANRSNPRPTMDDLIASLCRATSWNKPSLEYLAATHFELRVEDFKNEIALNRLNEVMQIVTKTGIAAATIAEWGAAATEFEQLHNMAQTLNSAVKAKYEEDDWLELAGNLSDKIRESQKQALISYLLTQPDIQAAGVRDADGLFEHLLIDVQMGACMDTSRIVQAGAAIQMFVNRCLLNLESDMSSGSEKGVSPGAIDKDRWEWMKNYRVWEANRKVFLYPENWLEPEWRSDRSEFFKELESYLVQNDITNRSVEQGLRNYLMSLNEVANLEVCGMYQENYDDGSLKYLHVFARTNNAPYKFFYRRWNEHRKWSAWEKMQLDVRSVEDGDNSGVHLIPVVWKKRLLLFWPEFMEKQAESRHYDKTSDIEDIGKNRSIADLEARKFWEIRLAWSEYADGKWSPKQVSKDFVKSKFVKISELNFRTYISANPRTPDLRILLTYVSHLSSTEWKFGEFILPDIQSKVNAIRQGESSGYSFYANTYMKRDKGYSPLELDGNLYLKRKMDHFLLNSSNAEFPDKALDGPLFFSDAYRTYFVRPQDINMIQWLKFPEYSSPYIPEEDYGRELTMPFESLDIGSGGSMAEESPTPPFAVGIPAGERKITLETSGKEIAHVDEAFGAGKDMSSWDIQKYKGLEFNTFYHPFSSDYVKKFNQGGLSRGNKPKEAYPPGLMESDTEIDPDAGFKFESEYNPNFEQGLVRPHPDNLDKRTYYQENVCFDPHGANSLYNWELFFHAPLYIATRLSKNGKFEEAMNWFHYIFDPTTDEMPGAGESEISRYWKVLPFKTTPAQALEGLFVKLNKETDPSSPEFDPGSEYFGIVSEWRDNPFDPHLAASNRPLAYMKHVVVRYVENLIAWGDSLFRRFTRESVNEALQIYVIADHVLGPHPEFVPSRGKIKAKSYDSLKNNWDAFSNALVQLENIFPYSSGVSVDSTAAGTSLLGIGSALYFCIPENDKLLEYWDIVADRLFKIRHCRDIDGVERSLALFAPPISPEALIQARSQELSLGSILADLSSPPPIYRFTYLIHKANEFCSDVKALGSALLAALEKKDAEELSRLRVSHETQMLESAKAIRERQVLDAKAYKENLLKVRETAKFRLQHYIDLLGHESVAVPAEPSVDATLTADSQLPVDTSIENVETDVDESLVDSDKSGVKLIPREMEELAKNDLAKWSQTGAGAADTLAGIFNMFVQGSADNKPLGVGAGVAWGGINLGNASSAVASGLRTVSQYYFAEASLAAKMASYIRREQDWTLQANLAAKEIIQLDKQITSPDIRIQVAEKELENHEQQIENVEDVELFIKDKFTNQELYQWLKEQLLAVYKQSYNLAYDMAMKAEKAYQYERGLATTSFIRYGYWDNSKQGLVAGEKLQLALRQLERSCLEENRRELELSKSVSMVLLNPLALIELRETGKCYLSLPEEIFDLDFQGHYFRRIKSVSLSIPCIVGPYTTVNCSLRLLRNTFRINTSMIGDSRFRNSNVPVTSIATSSGQNDAGMFEFNFRDERYLPFEGAGVISDWMIELTAEKALRQFDYATISDVILHLKYTAKESGGQFKKNVVDNIRNFMTTGQPLMRMFSMKHEFPTEWHNFLHPAVEGEEQVLKFSVGKERLPFFAQDRTIVVMKIEVFAKCTREDDDLNYVMIMSYRMHDETLATTSPTAMRQNDTYGELNKATINDGDAELDLKELSINKEMSLKVKHHEASDYTRLAAEPGEVEDIFLVIHYKL